MKARVVGVALTLGGLWASASASYTVAMGDTLSAIAARHGLTIRGIAQENGLANPDRIYAGQRLRMPSRDGSGTGAAATAPARGEVTALLEQTARRYGWNPAFVKALSWQESGWKQHVVSSVGAVGLMQVMPETGRFVSRALVGRTLDLRNPADNVEAGVAFLDYLYRETGRDPRLTLAAYYQGLASVRRHGLYNETERFVANVLALRERFR